MGKALLSNRVPVLADHGLQITSPWAASTSSTRELPTTRGDPMSPLRWTCKSTRNLAAELRRHMREQLEAALRGIAWEYGA